MKALKNKKTKPARGKFIVIDGGDGTGTSSVTRYLAQVFGKRAIQTCEPGGSPFAEKIRELLLHPLAKEADAGTMLALFYTARWDHMLKVVMPALKKGLHVFCDRFDSSTYAYQIHAEKRPDLKPLFYANKKTLESISRAPDHYIILDGDPRVCLPRTRRRAQRTKGALNHFDTRKLAYHDAVRKGFLEFIQDKPHTIINAEQSEEAVKREVLKAVRAIITST